MLLTTQGSSHMRATESFWRQWCQDDWWNVCGRHWTGLHISRKRFYQSSVQKPYCRLASILFNPTWFPFEWAAGLVCSPPNGQTSYRCQENRREICRRHWSRPTWINWQNVVEQFQWRLLSLNVGRTQIWYTTWRNNCRCFERGWRCLIHLGNGPWSWRQRFPTFRPLVFIFFRVSSFGWSLRELSKAIAGCFLDQWL